MDMGLQWHSVGTSVAVDFPAPLWEEAAAAGAIPMLLWRKAAVLAAAGS